MRARSVRHAARRLPAITRPRPQAPALGTGARPRAPPRAPTARRRQALLLGPTATSGSYRVASLSMIVSWVLFPLVLAAIGAGWGAAVERASGARVNDALLMPLGLAAALVVAGTLTAFTATAPAAVTVVAVGAVAGLVLAWPGRRLFGWPLLAAVAVLLCYGAPVLLSGQATFLGFVKLDDTATWFNIIDHVMSHARFGQRRSTLHLHADA